MFDKGFCGGLFDFNGDGKLDGFEKAADFAAFMNIIKGDEEEISDDDSDTFDFDEDEDEDEDFDDIEDDD